MSSLKEVKVAILSADGFEESELIKPRDALKDAGASVSIISIEKGKIQGMKHDKKGESVKVDEILGEADPAQFDALVIPGGLMNPDTLRTNQQALDFTRAFFDAGKPVGTICHGPQVLISAELVKDRKMTAVKSVRTDLQNAGAEVFDEEVVIDQGLVTSRTPEDLPAFCAALIEEFGEGYHRGQAHPDQAPSLAA